MAASQPAGAVPQDVFYDSLQTLLMNVSPAFVAAYNEAVSQSLLSGVASHRAVQAEE